MNPPIQLTNEELGEVIHLIRTQYGYDFSDYARASLLRRVNRCMSIAGLKAGYELKYHLINDKSFFAWFLETLTVNVTEMFRDPSFYKELREKVLPALASYPIIKIWHAGCATGEEVYSMAILLQEAGLLNRARIYATDLNPVNLERARQGIIPLKLIKEYTANYIQSGGQNDFSSYYTAQYDNAIIHKEYRDCVLFAQHNLVADHVFNEFQLICCRNVMIYFNQELQNRTIHLFHESLSFLGYLALGIKESLLFTDIKEQFETVSLAARIYRRKSKIR
ncbi:CheR family methyltransferase [Runella slithyformis]|uniref:MCP methyltransferase, CheR-type n=1 Tax=Runella slithyformis (strain ATCC 29530 / DSM 19594 / LMG 11500 / NCIMB 11436 / LSU 4) TaxID=761193 RepID=A0A7U4E6N1_RUNSL|nr:protein-glutamate O-methyltransferase CheR [Runella slithyformis]AEI49758.1 MCP methyltransferase, CheR-type [Runella slithyformis DSM 19594]